MGPLRFVDPLGLKIWYDGSNSWSDRKESGRVPWDRWDGGSGSRNSSSANCPDSAPDREEKPFNDSKHWETGGTQYRYAGNEGNPGSNRAQNRQVDAVVNALQLTPGQRELLHREISGQNYPHHEILQIGREIKGGR